MKFSYTTQSFYPDDIEYPNTPADLVEVSDDEHKIAINRPTGSTLAIENGVLVIVAPHPTIVQAQFQQMQTLAFLESAKSALVKSDTVLLRCAEDDIAIPSDWVAYRKALRAIVSKTDTTSTALPVAPAYPAVI